MRIISASFLLPALLFAFLGCTSPNLEEGIAAYDAKDYFKSYDHFRRLSEKKGDATAQYYLGLQYTNGYGVDRNSDLALKWFKASADQGNENGQYQYGVHLIGHEARQPTEAEFIESYKWFLLAEQKGHVKAKIFTVGLKERLSPEAIQKARNRAEIWQPAS